MEQKDDYYKPIRVGNFWNNSYTEYESNGDRNKKPSVKEYLNKIKPYLRNIIIDLQKYRVWNIQLTMVINLIPTKDVDEDRVMHSKSGNTKFLIYDNANDVVDEVFESLLSRYQIGLTESMRGNNFIFDSFKFLCYKCHNLKRGGSYIKSPDEKQEIKKNPKNEDDKCFQYAATIASNHE